MLIFIRLVVRCLQGCCRLWSVPCIPSLPCNSTAEKAAGSTQTQCLQMLGLKSFLLQASQMSSPAACCSVIILPGGCHCSMLSCELVWTLGQLTATGHGALGDHALAIVGGERKQRSLCLQHSPVPLRLGLPEGPCQS